jgi:hypothetical protein
MLLRLVLAELRHRPGRALFLLAGYALGVSVMVVLLAVGEAMLEQARDRALVGGGEMVVVPAGISAEMLRAGGATSLFLGLDQARFVQRQILESPRGRADFGVRAASPILDGKLVELHVGGDTLRAIASGEIPSRAAAAGAAPRLLAGRWEDSPADRRWAEPSAEALFHEIDRFHVPRGAAAGDSTWAEWHYFNVILAPDRWIYLTFMVAGRVGTPGEWGGRVLLTVRDEAGHRALTRDLPDTEVRFDTTRADLSLGPANTVQQRGGVYAVRADVGGARIDLRVRPAPGRYFPPSDLGGTDLISGYVAPALYATAEGDVCLPGRPCERIEGAQAYHDHNWGIWRDVSWEWGAASDSALSLLYGVVRGEAGTDPGLFVYLVDSRGGGGVFRPPPPRVSAQPKVVFEGRRLRLPTRLGFEDARRGLRVRIDAPIRNITDTGRDRQRYFIQMRGVATVEETGYPVARLPGFFETYVDATP